MPEVKYEQNFTECAPSVENTDSGTCLDVNFVNNLSKLFTNDTTSFGGKIIDVVKKKTKCKTDSCLLNSKIILDNISYSVIKEQYDRLKPIGPLDKDEWLSNRHIDNVLHQFTKKYTYFKHIPFQMRDFKKTKSELLDIDFCKEYENGVKCFGVIFNDDVSSGRGTHWTAVFGDFRKIPFTIEHFNSTGAGPKHEIELWMNDTANMINRRKKECNTQVIKVSDIQHQTDNSSCGPYSLYYIIARLEGVDYVFFKKNIINTDRMWKFRRALFRNN